MYESSTLLSDISSGWRLVCCGEIRKKCDKRLNNDQIPAIRSDYQVLIISCQNKICESTPPGSLSSNVPLTLLDQSGRSTNESSANFKDSR